MTKFRDPLDDPRAPVAGLQLADVLDLRAYERVRDDYRRQIIEHKRRRRIALGPIVTLLFESFDTVRFQVHEMARAERIVTDEGIEGELDAYNRLLPVRGELSATLFIELTSEEDLRHWLPRLVGIEQAVGFRVGAAGEERFVMAEPELAHAQAPHARRRHPGRPLPALRLRPGRTARLRRRVARPRGPPPQLRGRDRTRGTNPQRPVGRARGASGAAAVPLNCLCRHPTRADGA